MCNANGYDLSLQIKVLSHLALASTTRHGHSSQNARYVQFVKEHATGFSARAFQSSSVRDSFRGTFMVVGLGGLEPPASPLSGVRSNHLSYRPVLSRAPDGGASRDRTDDPLLAKQVLSQLSYGPNAVVESRGTHSWMQVTCADAWTGHRPSFCL